LNAIDDRLDAIDRELAHAAERLRVLTVQLQKLNNLIHDAVRRGNNEGSTNE
jgi:hypothetical protein